MKRNECGFTLIELLVVVAIAGVLVALAMPSFQSAMQKRSATSVAESLVSDLRFARTEALKRTTPVTVCQSSDAATCNTDHGGWRNGWIVFVDFNGNATVNAGDALLRVQSAPSGISLIQNNPATDLKRFTYQANGNARAATQTLFVVPSGVMVGNLNRVVCVSIAGRPSLRAEGTLAC